MSSGLRFSSTPSGDCIVPTIRRPTVSTPPTKKSKMSLTQTYYLAHTARSKLSKEAARGDHDLRLLVGHANLLDGLMLDLANAEQEQESWFNNTVNTAAKSSSTEPKRVQWADEHIIAEEADDSEEEELYDESEDSDDEDDESEIEAASLPTLARKQTTTSSPQAMTIQLDDDEDDVMDDDDYEEELALTRSPTHVSSPPELMHEDSSESESEDEVALPPSPPQTELSLTLGAFSEKQRQAIATTSYYHQSISPPSSGSPSSTSHETSFFDQQPIAIAAY